MTRKIFTEYPAITGRRGKVEEQVELVDSVANIYLLI